MNSVSRVFRLIGVATLCMAALLIAALPGGYLPRLAGPCGQQLCLCQLEVSNDSDETGLFIDGLEFPATFSTKKITRPEARWIFVEQISGFDVQVSVVMHTLLNADTGRSVEIVTAADPQESVAPAGALLSGHNVVLDYPTPPPRA